MHQFCYKLPSLQLILLVCRVYWHQNGQDISILSWETILQKNSGQCIKNLDILSSPLSQINQSIYYKFVLLLICSIQNYHYQKMGPPETTSSLIKVNPQQQNTSSEIAGDYRKIIYPNGNSYEGYFKYDAYNGFGTFRFADGESYYKGNFVDFQFHGRGLYKYSNGNVYDGYWKNDMRSGYGVLKYKNEQRYLGQWSYDLQDGPGVLFYKNGDTYEGNWQAGKIHGFGVATFQKGYRFEGEWILGKVKTGILKSEVTGQIYEGKLIKGRRDGFGALKHKNENGMTGLGLVKAIKLENNGKESRWSNVSQ